MLICLIVCIVLLLGVCAYFFHSLKKAKQKIQELEIRNQQSKERLNKLLDEQISDADLKFIDFTVDMYIDYAKDFGIHSETQHEIIVKELQRIKEKYLNKT